MTLRTIAALIGAGAILLLVACSGDTATPSPTAEPSLPLRWQSATPSSPTVSPTPTPIPTPSPIPTEHPTKTPTPTPKPPPLQIESFKCTWRSSYAYVEGEVTNLSGTRLENVMAVGTWYADDGTFITSDDALIDFDPLLPGQTSPFKTFSRYNPAMDNCKLEFRELFGEKIPAQRVP